MTKIPKSYFDLMEDKGIAHLATIGPKGEPHTSPVWYDFDGENVLVSHTKERQKFANVQRDPRVALSILDPADPYRFIEIRGKVEVIDDPDKTLIHKLSAKYRGVDTYTFDGPKDNRVIFKIRPDRVVAHG